MPEHTKNLEASWKERSEKTKKKALEAMRELSSEQEPVNFNSVHLRSGVSKHLLYKDEEVRKAIETARGEEESRKKAWHSKYDKTSGSKDVIIASKEKYIAKLESENEQLRKELNRLRALIYEKK